MLIHASLEAMDFSQSFASQGICDSVQLRNRTESQSLETAQLFSGQALRGLDNSQARGAPVRPVQLISSSSRNIVVGPQPAAR